MWGIVYAKFLGPQNIWGMRRVSGNEMIAGALQMIGTSVE